ncbi:MAG: acyltransferase family protein [Janthinobacterium lividum]
MTASTNSHTANNLDLMRLVFASMVLLSHASELIYGDRSHELLTQTFHTISFGELGVDCFFILSGFMIANSWERDPRWWSFLVKRALRIYPGFIVAYLASTVIVGAIGAANARGYLAGLHPALMLQELAKLHGPSNPPTFEGSYDAGVNWPLWTIRYEFGCYLLVLAMGLAGLLASARVTTLLWLASLVAFLIFRVHHSGGGPGAIEGGHKVTLLRLVPMYLSGVVIYKAGVWKVRSPLLIGAAVVLLIAGLAFPVTAETAVATAGAYLLFITGFTPIRHPEARRLPDVSYGVYLYGWPVQKLLLLWWPAGPFLGIFALSFAGAVALGFASWFAVEKPALALKRLTWPLARQGV